MSLNEEDIVNGYGMIRKTMSDEWHLGPLQANDEETAEKLFSALCHEKQG